MKVKKRKKKLVNKFENTENNNDLEHPELNTLKKCVLDFFDKNDNIIDGKNKNFEYKNCLKKLYYFASIEIKKKYDCTPSKYDSYNLNYLLNNIDCHLVSQFKEKMLTDYIEEFLRRQYNISEIHERIPKFSVYYKSYLNFFCKPTYNNLKYNKIIQKYGEKKAELYYKQNYQAGMSFDEENIGMEESNSNESSNKDNEYAFTEDGKIFNQNIKEKIDNVTVMTTINTTGNNTINLNMNNEKIEVFSENKAEISNDTTIGEIMDDIKNELKKIKHKKNKIIKKKFKYPYKNIMNYSLKSQQNYYDKKYHKNSSMENRKKMNKDISNKISLNKDNKFNINKTKIKFSNNNIISQRIKSQIFKYNIESYKINKNRLHKISREKIQKILKSRYSKSKYQNLYSNNYPYNNFSKESKTNIRNISSNIKSTDNRNKKTNISGFSDRKKKYKSRNNLDTFYNYGVEEVNSTANQNSHINFYTTHFNKKSLNNLVKSGNKTFRAMNIIKTAFHQRTNSQFLQNKKIIKNNMKLNQKIDKNNTHGKKTSSLKLLTTDIENNHKLINPSIKIKKNEKLKNKLYNIDNNKNNNKKNNSIIKKKNNNNNNNLKITVSTNNYFKSIKNRNSKADNPNIYKAFKDSYNNLTINNQNYSDMIQNLNQHQIIYNNNECETSRQNLNFNYNEATKNNSNLVQIALSLLIDNNSPKTKNLVNNNTSLNTKNNNCLKKNNIMNQKDNKNKYLNINSPTHYNININNHINININGNINGKINDIRSFKSNSTKTKKKININISNQKRKNININKKKPKLEQINNKIKNLKNKSNNKARIKTRNIKDFLNYAFTQNININSSRNDKVIKGYYTKSLSDLNELINHNKKLIAFYKNMIQQKEKNKV